MKLDIKKQTYTVYNNYSGLPFEMQLLKAIMQVKPESLEGLFNPASSKVKNENNASEIGFPTLTTGAFPNQKFNKQASHESKKTVDSSCISF